MFAFLKILLGLASHVAKYLGDKQLLDAGQSRAIAANLEKAKRHVQKADTARRTVSVDADSLQNDPNDRANTE